MKYLIVLFVVALAIWLWRRNRREEMEEAAKAAKPAARPRVGEPQAMVRCAHCGLHLPASDAIAGPGGGVYCSIAHRQAAAG